MGLTPSKRIEQTLHNLQNPQLSIGTVIHVAGTNGKGSVCALVSTALREIPGPSTSKTLRVARFSSPHFINRRDSITINNEMIDQNAYDRYRQIVLEASVEEMSSFEVETAIAFCWFRDKQVDVSVVEVGLGGRLDATNMFPNAICVITSLGMDHMEFLGSTIESIASEKAGIIKPGSKVCVLGEQKAFPCAVSVVAGRASEMNVPLVETETVACVGEDLSHAREGASFQSVRGSLFGYPRTIKLPLLGSHQLQNLSISLKVIDFLASSTKLFPPNDDTATRIIQGLESTKWQGRLEYVYPPRLSRPILCDGAHNEQGAAVLVEYITTVLRVARFQDAKPFTRVHWILGCKDGTDDRTDRLMSALLTADIEQTVWIVDFEAPEGMPWVKACEGEKLAASIRRAASGRIDSVEIVGGVTEAISKLVQEGMNADTYYVCCGSLYLMASLYRKLSVRRHENPEP